ncbi:MULTISPECIES: hypothetical protein [Rheinheimera]|uniref:Uncharacterized protein n=1 Tax=Rheinheimera marina TaxID=1774958 RepID=A0ABV9JJF2_9GAMM
MEHYDDVLQFVTKTGAQNLNYKNFESAAFTAGNSRWKLINQVALFDRDTAEFARTPASEFNSYPYTDNGAARSEPLAQVARLNSVESTKEHLDTNGTAREDSIRDMSHLFLKTPNQTPTPEKSSASPLSLLLERIGA